MRVDHSASWDLSRKDDPDAAILEPDDSLRDLGVIPVGVKRADREEVHDNDMHPGIASMPDARFHVRKVMEHVEDYDPA